MWDLTIHSPLGPCIIADIRSLLQLMWDPPIHTPSGPSILAGTPPRVHPLRGQPPHWHIARCLTLIPFVTAKSTASRNCPLWAFPFGLPLKVFKMSDRERFLHPYKEYFVLLLNRCGISQSNWEVPHQLEKRTSASKNAGP